MEIILWQCSNRAAATTKGFWDQSNCNLVTKLKNLPINKLYIFAWLLPHNITIATPTPPRYRAYIQQVLPEVTDSLIMFPVSLLITNLFIMPSYPWNPTTDN